MNAIRISKLLNRIWLLLALFLFNMSIDVPDATGTAPEDLSYNDIESMVELVLESCLGIDNAIPEQDDADDSEGSGIVKKMTYEFASFRIISKSELATITQNFERKHGYAYVQSLTPSDFLSEINQPPEA